MVFTRTLNRDYGLDYSVYDVVGSVCLLVCIPGDLTRRKRGNNRLLARTNFSCRRKFLTVVTEIVGFFFSRQLFEIRNILFSSALFTVKSISRKEKYTNLDGLENFWNLV